MILNESEIYPYEISHLADRHCLVIAPHPDDESIGCGGSIVKHINWGSSVKVIFLSNGERGDFEQVYGEDYVKIRQGSAVEALSLLGVKDFEFWGFRDRCLYQDESLIYTRIRKELERFAGSIIYAPSPYEAHPDHRVAASIGWQIYCELGIPVAFYEIIIPLFPDTLVDISEEFRIKRSAIECYKTELFYNDYFDKIEGLNRSRTVTLPSHVKYAEAFVLFGGEKRETVGKRLLKNLIHHLSS